MTKEFIPGEVALESGVYRVVHYAHRLPHNVVVLQGDVFPLCKKCQAKVSFEIVSAGVIVADDRDFRADADNEIPPMTQSAK